jgi:hypothetical protein
MSAMSSVFTNEIPVFKALYYEGKCFNLSTEDTMYLDVLGKYKLTAEDEETLDRRKIEIEKLDWLWDQIRNTDEDDFIKLGEILQSIETEESKAIAIDILKRSKCNNLLSRYVAFLKEQVDKRLKTLNLKYDGYLINYQTSIPRLIHDRVFKGITITLYVYGDCPEHYHDYRVSTYSTTTYNFGSEILSDTFKKNIVGSLNTIKGMDFNILNIIKLFVNENKLIEHSVEFKERTDYRYLLRFKDYRNKDFIVMMCQDYNWSHSNNKYPVNVIKISTWDVTKQLFVTETIDSYKITSLPIPKYEYGKIIKQSNISFSYRVTDQSFRHFLPRYDFVKALEEIISLTGNISYFCNQCARNADPNVIQKEYVSDTQINKKIEQILYPLIHRANNTQGNDLNVIFNKDFTKDKYGNLRPWVIRDFIDYLSILGIKNIKNII